MKRIYGVVVVFVIVFVLLVPSKLLGEKKAAAAPGTKAESAAEKEAPKGKVLYDQNFEETDEDDAWSSECDVEWKKGGAEDSKGCLKIYNSKDGTASVEKNTEWYDNKTVIEFDYKTDFPEDLYVLARGVNANVNVRAHIKGFPKGKWAHAKVKAASLDMHGTTGKGDTFHNLVIVGTGGSGKAVLLLDNIVIRAEGGAGKESDD